MEEKLKESSVNTEKNNNCSEVWFDTYIFFSKKHFSID